MRDTFVSLDGEWSFAFDDADIGLGEGWFYTDHNLPLTIRVPYCYQCEKSGIGGDEIHSILWYRRSFALPTQWNGQRVLLRFGAVDWSCRVYVNGVAVGEHAGGYTPFALDITPALKWGQSNDLCLRVVDMSDVAQPRGKQYWKRGLMGCWYTPTSGVWQSVYLEAAGRPATPYITRVHVEPDIDNHVATVTIALNREPSSPLNVSFALDQHVDDIPRERPVAVSAVVRSREASFPIDMHSAGAIEGLRLWSPENPNLYGLTVALADEAVVIDRIYTYFGMRSIEIREGDVLLNHRPLYQRLVLDQGYWPDTLLTPPDDEAIQADIRWTKVFGFNGARKHQKIEVPRWYYWADKMGLLVWGELPSAYSYTPDSTRALIDTMQAFIDRDFNHPCIIAWTPLNESWGVPSIYANTKQQEFSRTLYHLCKSLDGTRLVSGNDGWEQVKTDIFALHDYMQDGDVLFERIKDRGQLDRIGVADRVSWAKGITPDKNAPFLLTEYGGTAFDDIGAQGELGGMQTWGYGDKINGEKAFLERFGKIQQAVNRVPFCKGTCYTQLTDVQQEINGLLTPDRKPKVSPEAFAKLNAIPMR
jgi:beta-galactosidase/beta-glucuronidase